MFLTQIEQVLIRWHVSSALCTLMAIKSQKVILWQTYLQETKKKYNYHFKYYPCIYNKLKKYVLKEKLRLLAIYEFTHFSMKSDKEVWNKIWNLEALIAPQSGNEAIQRVPALRTFWDMEKTVLHEICVSGTVLWSPTNANSPTYTYISQKSW